jgi:hypothetical protein
LGQYEKIVVWPSSRLHCPVVNRGRKFTAFEFADDLFRPRLVIREKTLNDDPRLFLDELRYGLSGVVVIHA